MPTGFCILSACSELRDPCAEARWRFRLRFLRFPFFVVLKLDVRAKRGRRATRLFRRRGRTPLATACAAHFVRRICRYYPLPTANYQLFSINYISTRPFRRRGRRRYYTAIFHDGEAPSLREGRAPARPRFLRCVVLCVAPAGQSLAIRPRAGVFGGRSRPPRRGSWRRAWRRWR